MVRKKERQRGEFTGNTHLEVSANDHQIHAVPAFEGSSFLHRGVDIIQATMALSTRQHLTIEGRLFQSRKLLTQPSTATLTGGEADFDVSIM